MAALDRGLRRELGRAVQKARKIAESGARAALGALMVGEGEADASLKVSDRALRRRLRAHGRQLGDAREDSGRQEVTRLAHEVAYEHWHRMLFARFLAENGLLIEPDSGVAVSLEDCRELARAQKMDPWALAGGFAAAMLPEIFRPDDPSLAIALPPETRRSLEKTLADLPPPVFHAGDALGWTYQYWQTDRKEEVNRSGVRIGAEELPAVTQLFTEPYMVRFLFHNTVGAWRAGRLLAERPELAETAENEDELRRAVRLESEGGYDFDFLRFVREGPDDGDGAAGRWCPAAGSYDRWPNHAAELRVLDPCCGSGHFLVEGLHLFVRLRMEEENLPIEDAVRAVLRDNLHGLEIDPRCSQIAAFSVAFAAWKLVGRVIDLLPLRLACSGFAPNATKDEWIALADRAAGAAGSAPQKGLFSKRDTIISADLRNTFEALHDMFVQAPTVGSLIDPHLAGASMYAAKFDAACPLLDAVLSAEEPDPEQRERAVAAAGMAEAASILAETYSLVITNVPYLGRGRQNSTLRELGDSRFGISRRNLATMFMERGFSWTKAGGTEALVVPEQCLFLKRYRGLRKVLLNQRQWRVVVWLGEHAFEDPSASGAFGAMTIVSRDAPDVTWEMAGVDVSAPHGERSIHTHEKAHRLRDETVRIISQRRQLRNPNSAILIEPMDTGRLLSEFAESFQGIGTKDYHRFGRCFWEFAALSESWRFQQSTARRSARFAGLEHVLLWEKGRGELDRLRRGGTLVVITGLSAWNRRGIAVSPTGNIRATAYLGEPFDDNTGVIVPKNESHYASIVSFCTSQLYSREVRRLDPSLKVTYPTLVNIPFNLDHWKAVAAEEFPNGLPEPYSDDPTQWIFHGHPCSSVVWDEDERRTAGGPVRTDTTVLQVAVARLLGYRWPAERDSEMCLADEQRNCVDRCANLHELADEDGIVCLPAVRGEASAADRLRGLLVAAYGREWAGAIEYRLLRATVGGGSLDDWLRRDFFKAHCGLFHHRPFIWHIWDGLPNGFHALVNYHRLAGPDGEGRKTLESMTFSYLGDWIARQKAAQSEGVPGAEARLAAALELQRQLQAILEGKPPLDLFVRWKPLHRQPLGWDPDLDDGVRLNIRPFLRAVLRRGLKGAGILRAKPNIHWKKDRGKERQKLRARRRGDPPDEVRPKSDFPWFWGCPGGRTEAERTDFRGGSAFDGNRWNDLHYTLQVKRDARVCHERDSRAAASGADDSAGTTGANEARENT